MRRCGEECRRNCRKRYACLRDEKVVHVNGEMETLIRGMIFAVMAMLSAIIRIGIAKTYFNRAS